MVVETLNKTRNQVAGEEVGVGTKHLTGTNEPLSLASAVCAERAVNSVATVAGMSLGIDPNTYSPFHQSCCRFGTECLQCQPQGPILSPQCGPI